MKIKIPAHYSALLLGLTIALAALALFATEFGPKPQNAFAKEEQAEKKETKAKEESAPKKEAAKAPAKPAGMPVDAVIVKKEAIQIWNQYSGSIVAVDRADLRPQVSGRITEIRFEDGQYVKKGDILIVIDPRPYEAALKQAKAALATARTTLDLTQKDHKRAVELVKKKAVSERLLDERSNSLRVAEAELLRTEALVEQAEINLDYAYVKAPIDGKVSRAEITEGNLVQSGGNAPLLTSIVADKKVYVDFEVDEQTYIKSVRDIPQSDVARIPVRVSISGDDLKYEGNIHSFDNRLDATSGTIRGRAILVNKDRKLLPGMTVSVEIGSIDNTQNKMIAISERAIGTDQDRKFVYVVNDENKASYREVKIGLSVNGRRIITDGLKEGETVITSGLVRIRPNMAVSPKLNNKSAQKQTLETTQLTQK